MNWCTVVRSSWLAAWVAGSAAAGPVKTYFTQPFPGSAPFYGSSAMSPDGRSVVGNVANPFPIWDQAWLMTPCQTVPLPDMGFGATASGVSNNGAVVVGSIVNPFVGGGVFIAVRWDAPGYAYTPLPTPAGLSAEATSITADGRIIVGFLFGANGRAPGFVSVNGGPPVGVGRLPGFVHNYLMEVAPDGSAAAGYAQSAAGSRAVWFRPGSGLALLPNPPGGVFQYAFGVSAAPNRVVGWGTVGATVRAMVSDGVSTVPLGTLPGDNLSTAMGISADGTTIIGISSGPSSSPLTLDTVFIDMAGVGMLDLQATLSGVLGYQGLASWYLIDGASAASGLRAFAGTAANPATGQLAGVLISICPADFNRDGVTDLQDYAPFGAAFNAGSCEADLDEDGLFTPGDHAEFFNSVVTGC